VSEESRAAECKVIHQLIKDRGMDFAITHVAGVIVNLRAALKAISDILDIARKKGGL